MYRTSLCFMSRFTKRFSGRRNRERILAEDNDAFVRGGLGEVARTQLFLASSSSFDHLPSLSRCIQRPTFFRDTTFYPQHLPSRRFEWSVAPRWWRNRHAGFLSLFPWTSHNQPHDPHVPSKHRADYIKVHTTGNKHAHTYREPKTPTNSHKHRHATGHIHTGSHLLLSRRFLVDPAPNHRRGTSGGTTLVVFLARLAANLAFSAGANEEVVVLVLVALLGNLCSS